MDTSQRVLVVGAGLSGLCAAHRLRDLGISVTVLEARERVGGRVWSSTLADGTVVELGAEWIMAGDHAVRAAAQRFGVDLVETVADYGHREAWGPGAPSLQDQASFLADADRYHASLAPVERDSLTLGAFLDAVPSQDEASRSVVKVRLQGTCARRLDEIALEPHGDHDTFSMPAGPFHRMRGGNQGLANAMAGDLDDLRTGQVIEALEDYGTGVVAHAGSRTVVGTAAVVAVPAPIAARIRFTPGLPAAVASALTALPMGAASKLAAATRETPSPRSRQATDVSMWCWAADGEDGRARRCIAAFAGSVEAQRELGIDHGRTDRWFERIRAMNPDLSFVDEPVMYPWADDPFTLGAYSAWDRASTARARAGVFSGVVGRLAFAGEHTAGPDHHGTMEGAVRSGDRAADQVAALLK